MTAGPHELGVTFPKKPSVLLETDAAALPDSFQLLPASANPAGDLSVSIIGPYESKGPGDTPSRRRIFICAPYEPERGGALRQADPGVADAARLSAPGDRRRHQRADGLYREGRADGGLRRGHRDGAVAPCSSARSSCSASSGTRRASPPNTPYRVSDLELASRLSFFLWSSIPDDELLELAVAGTLHEPAVLERRSGGCWRTAGRRRWSTNFAAQWLHLRNLDSITPGHAAVPRLR